MDKVTQVQLTWQKSLLKEQWSLMKLRCGGGGGFKVQRSSLMGRSDAHTQNFRRALSPTV